MSTGFDDGHRRFLSLLAHELRNPVGAITGYQELLTEGVYGALDPRGMDALHRIGSSAEQLLSLLDGLNELISPGSSVKPDLAPTDIGAVLKRAIDDCRILAVARNATLEAELPDSLPSIVTDGERLARTLALAVGAAVRCSPGAKLTLRVFDLEDSALRLEVHGSALDGLRDDPTLPVLAANEDTLAVATGAGLRLAMARNLAQTLNGNVELHVTADGVVLHMHVGAVG